MQGNIPTVTSSTIDVVEYRLRFARTLMPGEATHLRGWFGRTFSDEVLLHHHESDGGLRYAYPLVQFKVLERTAHLIGLGEGAGLVTRLWSQVDETKIRDETLPVLESGVIRRRAEIGPSPTMFVYRFCTPWLGLNQENHRRYEEADGPNQRCALLERVLVGNCLSLAKTFGHRVLDRITAYATGLRPWPTRLKGVEMLGFLGTFRVNFHLPEHAGVGKSVSRGFGTVEQLSRPTPEGA